MPDTPRTTNIDLEGAEICVPASVANLGPGLDTLAVAVQLYLRVRIRKIHADRMNELDFDFGDLRFDGENYVERAFRYLANQCGSDFPSLSVEIRSEIPIQAGLGSSAAATVAGLKLYDLVVRPLSSQELLNAACELEGHPDNAAAALLGGLTSSCQLSDGSVIAMSSAWPEQVSFVVLTPEMPLETAVSRGALPDRIARADAVFNLQRVALLFQALHRGEYWLLREALRDRWHQPFRRALVPGLEEALALDHPDLLGVCLSGGGPSIVALAADNVSAIERLIVQSYSSNHIPYRVRTLRAHQNGIPRNLTRTQSLPVGPLSRRSGPVESVSSGDPTSTSGIRAAQRLEGVRYAIRDLAVMADDLTRQGKRVLRLNIGDPLRWDFETPVQLIEAAAKAMRDGRNGYAPALGIDEAREAVRMDAERKGIRTIQDAFITQGVSEGVDFCLTALLDPGDDLLAPSPLYPLYSAVLAKLGAVTNLYALNEEKGWEPDLDELASRITLRTRGIVIINPNNPTGALHTRHTLEGIAELARRHNLVILADEIYDRMIFDGGSHLAMAAIAPDVPVVTFGGLSKAYLAPGWRVAWAIVSGQASAVNPYLEGIHKLLRARLCANHPLQYAVRPALQGIQEHLVEVIRKLQARRDLTMAWCSATPHVSCVAPRGAFYAFPRLDIPEDDLEFVKALLVERQVLVVHGDGFSQAPGTRHVRIVFLPPEPILSGAYGAMAAFIRQRYG
jgi:alanine-synthesizing transaminase